ACVPYDVVNTEEARAMAAGNPLCFLHVSRAEIDLPANVDPYDDRVYAGAKRQFQQLIEAGTLQRENVPTLYAYRQQTELLGRKVSQTGIVGCCHIDDYNSGVIKKHEVTRKDKEDDRTRHTLAINANAGPVFLAHKPQPELRTLISVATAGAPLYDFVAPDGVQHTVWRISDPRPVVAAFGRIDCAYVADGHHRSASAARAGAERRANNPKHSGDEEYNWFLCVLFASDQLNVLPYHRLVRDLGGQDAASFVKVLETVATVSPTDTPIADRPGAFGMYLQGRWYRVQLPDAALQIADPVRSLDYVLLSEHVLSPLLGIHDLRTDKRIDFVGGIRGTGELERRVNSGEHAVGFAMRATSLEQLMRVADADLIMPPKSTWFEPKLRSGLLIHTLD
ncbi:MAG TPA: DUF1015 family protein, partial [Polyangiales bacterium]|nr:DUF1015 family protein [Polyangiales bacterium]